MSAPLSFQPFDPQFRRNPFPIYARGRRESPVMLHADLPIASVFGYDDIVEILKDPETWSSVFPVPAELETRRDLPRSMLAQDPPEHTRLRNLVSQAFTPRMISRLEPRIEQIAHELVGDAIRRREVDLVDALTHPLPMVVIAEIIGIPLEDQEHFKKWSEALIATLGVGLMQGAPSSRSIEAQVGVIEEMRSYFSQLVERRRAEPRKDLLSGLVAAELEGSKLSFNEMLQMLILLLVAGNETTTTLIGNAVIELLEHPEQLAQLRRQPELISGAIDEVLRFASPVQFDPRRATRSVELRGCKIEEGRVVICWLGSANRDETVFEEPDRFQLTRPSNRHLAFGFGPHYCLGANLARLEAQTALRVLLERTESIRRLDDEPLPLHPSPVFRGFTKLPLELVGRY